MQKKRDWTEDTILFGVNVVAHTHSPLIFIAPLHSRKEAIRQTNCNISTCSGHPLIHYHLLTSSLMHSFTFFTYSLFFLCTRFNSSITSLTWPHTLFSLRSQLGQTSWHVHYTCCLPRLPLQYCTRLWSGIHTHPHITRSFSPLSMTISIFLFALPLLPHLTLSLYRSSTVRARLQARTARVWFSSMLRPPRAWHSTPFSY